MTQLYTGTPYKGQNNLTVQGCFHASISHGEAATKTLALAGLKVYTQRVQGALDAGACAGQVATLETSLNTLPTEEQPMLAWALNALRTL